MKPKEDQLPATQDNNVNKDSGKRLLSDDSSPNNKQNPRKKSSIGEHDDSSFGRDPEISSGSSSVDFSEFKVFAEPLLPRTDPKVHRQTFRLCLSKTILQV